MRKKEDIANIASLLTVNLDINTWSIGQCGL